MNQERLKQIIDQYITRFDELNDTSTNDEGYKWRAVTCFKENWNIEAKDFSNMFKQAMQKTSNLIDNKSVQPIGGIIELLSHGEEIEFVRECFKELFSEDNGDLVKRQARIEEFMTKINARIEHYVAGSWKYPQKLNNVIYYLNLWKPEENYIYKYTEASAWADCVEFGDDFGSGADFSLEKYYRMCDELLMELPKYDQLMELHGKRVAREVSKYDDQLHILVYDIIYCAHTYNFYSHIKFQKVPVKVRIEQACKQKEIEEINEGIKASETLLRELEERCTLPDLTNTQVRHKKFGKGIVESCDDKYLVINFGGEKKKLQYLFSIMQGILSCEDECLVAEIKEIHELHTQIESQKNKIKNLNMRLELLA